MVATLIRLVRVGLKVGGVAIEGRLGPPPTIFNEVRYGPSTSALFSPAPYQAHCIDPIPNRQETSRQTVYPPVDHWQHYATLLMVCAHWMLRQLRVHPAFSPILGAGLAQASDPADNEVIYSPADWPIQGRRAAHRTTLIPTAGCAWVKAGSQEGRPEQISGRTPSSALIASWVQPIAQVIPQIEYGGESRTGRSPGR
ncbi:hypothetical protein L207DRAFT_536028 [Hyaloscypha variabilis F]|uniref:Uncharacterized protein n=1 Tax=Hyaloscypha variabilis (strain UAMH 11265 / GT02V1 / F) TaxID=1149755 RepID=A0A2J6R2J0_HYAVF|nr:hypothetical protein L207DRAFT_536028 [Hyaloscypha variabilis F]